MSQKSILENISSPKDLKILSLDQLSILSDELRSELISSVSKNWWPLRSRLRCNRVNHSTPLYF